MRILLECIFIGVGIEIKDKLFLVAFLPCVNILPINSSVMQFKGTDSETGILCYFRYFLPYMIYFAVEYNYTLLMD